MPRESLVARQQRVTSLCAVLRAVYPEAHCELNYQNPLQLLVATILSAQCTDKTVNLVTAELFQKYPSAADFARADLSELTTDIRRIGLYRNKAKFIQSCCRALLADHAGKVPAQLDALTALAGVGRKTANVVLGNAFGINSGVVVDTHVSRLAGRLNLSRHDSPVAIERDLQELVPRAEWTVFSHWLIWHGRRRCRARKPDCENCELLSLCPFAQRVGSDFAVGRSRQR